MLYPLFHKRAAIPARTDARVDVMRTGRSRIPSLWLNMCQRTRWFRNLCAATCHDTWTRLQLAPTWCGKFGSGPDEKFCRFVREEGIAYENGQSPSHERFST